MYKTSIRIYLLKDLPSSVATAPKTKPNIKIHILGLFDTGFTHKLIELEGWTTSSVETAGQNI